MQFLLYFIFWISHQRLQYSSGYNPPRYGHVTSVGGANVVVVMGDTDVVAPLCVVVIPCNSQYKLHNSSL